MCLCRLMESESENQNVNVAEADLPEIDHPAENQNTDDDVVEVELGSGPDEKKPGTSNPTRTRPITQNCHP